MKKIISVILILFIVNISYSQDKKDESSKMQEFVSKTGTILKFENYKLPNIKLNYGIAESKIRKIIAGNEVQYFLQISKANQYDTKIASIAHEDIIEIQKALLTLEDYSELDLNSVSDYLENKFITEDGFQIGYYVSKNKVKWYMQLEKYGNDNTIFPRGLETLKNVFQLGKEKIEELKLN